MPRFGSTGAARESNEEEWGSVPLDSTPQGCFTVGAQRSLIVSYHVLDTGLLSISHKTGFQNVGSEESQQHLEVS